MKIFKLFFHHRLFARWLCATACHLGVLLPLLGAPVLDENLSISLEGFLAQLSSPNSDASFSIDPDIASPPLHSASQPGPPLPAIPNPAEPQAQPAQQKNQPFLPTTSPTRTIITPHTNTDLQEASLHPEGTQNPKEISINFNNVAMIQYIQFISRLSNKNFIFDDEDLQFNVTIVSEEPTSVENLMSALLQELKIRDLSLIEEGNNILIHRNPRVKAPFRVVAGENQLIHSHESEIVTRVFRLNTLDPTKASEIIRPLLSADSLVEVLRDTNNLIITDLVANINKITQLIGTLDAPNSGITIGQYVVKNSFVDSLADLSLKIIQPIAQGNPFILVPHAASNSIYIVSNGFIVEKALAILQNLDLNEGRTKIFSLESLYPSNVQGYPGGGYSGKTEGGVAGSGVRVGQGGALSTEGASPGGVIPGLTTTYPISPGGIGTEGTAFLVAPDGYTIGADGYLLNREGRPVTPGSIGTEGYPLGPNGYLMALSARPITPGTIGSEGQNLFLSPLGYSVTDEGMLIGPEGRPVPQGSIGTEGYPVGPNGFVFAREGKAFEGGGISTQGFAPSPTPQSFRFAPGGIGTEGIISSTVPHSYRFVPGGLASEGAIPSAIPQNPRFAPGGIGTEGRQGTIFEETRDFLPGAISSSSRISQELPIGHIERTIFSIYKLVYRRGDQIEIALRKIALSLNQMGTANVDLLAAINSVQWIESTNAMILTGSPAAIARVRDLIMEIDTPLRQVFIECLLLQTSITDSLEYAVSIDQFIYGGSTTAFQGFNGNVGQDAANAIDFTTNPPSTTGLESVLNNIGYTAAVVGTHITHHGTRFNSITALVKALHQTGKTKIVLNPKIITEDNHTAEIFVGTTDRYKTQSITNELGNVITNNFQFIDVGTLLRVTPLIGNNGVITLDIVQETSTGDESANTTGGGSSFTSDTDVNLVPVMSMSRTSTRVHVPNGFFVILSGMMQDNETRALIQVPCLGGIPILGAAFKQKANADNKSNLMLFIRPLIVDTEDELEDITKRQQDVFIEKSKFRRAWNYEIDEALDQFNLKPTDPDEIGCDER